MKEHKEKLDEIWSRKPHGKVDFLGMENTLRGILKEFKEGTLNPTESLQWIDDYIAAFTRRGNEL